MTGFWRICAVAAFLAMLAGLARAHELWIAPHLFRPETGASLKADIRVGLMLKGDASPRVSALYDEFTITRRGETTPVGGRDGDLPALSVAEAQPGLNIATYRTKPVRANFADMAAFRKYLTYEGLDALEDRHRALGLPETGITEDYRRHAKALIQVGPVTAEDVDRPTGAAFELVARANPYAPGLASFRVALLRAGAPVADFPVALIRYDGEVRRRIVHTDASGEVEVDLRGGGSWLLNAVDLRPSDGAAVYESDWASLSFGIQLTDPAPHPLDPLTKLEIVRAVRAIGQSGHATRETRLALMALDEPEKAEVLAWTPGDPPRRRAFAVLRNGAETFEAVVDLAANRLDRWTPIDGEPAISGDDWRRAQTLTKADPRWRAAMAARGYETFDDIFCESLTPGWFPGEGAARLLKMPCYDIAGARTHIYGRPIEGLISVVDLDRGEVVEVIDTGPVPVNHGSHEFGPVTEETAPVAAARPFTLDGRRVTWGPWSFHLGFDPRFGPVLSQVAHRDGDEMRSVLYQGHLSEIFVPYMDASEGWYFRSYMDAGEYGVGAHASRLAPGLDCPAQALFLDEVLADRSGAPHTREALVCVFEREGAMPLWRHREALNGVHAARAARELVVRSIPSVGNYDYIIDWVFDLRGEIAVQVGATGIDAVKGVAARSMADPGAAADTATGMLVAPGLVAVHHDHFFSFRLDLDVDGPVNAFRRDRLAVEAVEGSPRRSLWRLTPAAAATETALSMRDGPELWRVEAMAPRGALGHRPSYQIKVTSDARSLLDPEDPPQRRAAFSGETLWLTAQHRGERSAAGPYPNRSKGGDGLPSYLDGEAVEGADVVAWATMGFHHLTRPEDWPVLPTVRHELRLRAYGFFEGSPGVEAE